MKTRSRPGSADDLRAEYDLRALLKDGVQGKYAARYREGTNVVVLDPDVARAFPSDEVVNETLRLVLRLNELSQLRDDDEAPAASAG